MAERQFPELVHKKLLGYKGAVKRYSRLGSGEAERIAHSTASMELLRNDPKYRDLILNVIGTRHDRRDPLSTSQIHTQIFRTVTYLIEQRDPEFLEPGRYTNPKIWYDLQREITHTPKLSADFFTQTAVNNLQSSVLARAKIPKFLMLAHEHRFPKPLRVLDIGSGLELTPKSITINYPYSDTTILNPRNRNRTSPHYQGLFDRMIPLQVEGMEATDVDLWWLDKDLSKKKFALSCSLNWEEKRDGKKRNDLLTVANAQTPNVKFIWTDITQPFADEELSKIPKSHIGILSTVLNQLNSDDQQATINRACDHLVPDGVLLGVDFWKGVDYSDRQRLVMRDDWTTPFSYRAYELDLRVREAGWQPLAYMNNGRCDQIQFAPNSETVRLAENKYL